MKRIVRRVQTLNERAAELTAAAGQMPNRVAELREAVTATSGELQNLRNGIEVNVADLKMTRDEDLSQALAEVAGHAPVLAEAGFVLDGLDVEVSPVQRVIVQLVRFDDVETLKIQALIQKYQQQKSVRAILSAILKARAMVETVHIDGLDFHKLTVGIGPIPTIRLCWRDTATDVDARQSAGGTPPRKSSLDAQQESFFGAPPVFASPPREPAPTPVEYAYAEPEVGEVEEYYEAAPPGLEATTFSTAGQWEDEAHEPVPHAAVAPPQAPAPPPLPVARPAAPAPPPLPSGPVDPLARFKVMPDLRR